MNEDFQRAGARLLVDLDAVAANWRLLSALVAPAAQAAAVVKANAYGLGASVVAPALAAAGCRRFVVATLDEALALRPLLGQADILVLSGPFPGSESDFAEAGLIPALNSPDQIERWAAFAARRERRFPTAIHVDTGMARLGLSAVELAALAGDADRLAALSPVLVMSHLACADEPGHPLNALQRDRFAQARQRLPGLPGSLAASSGIFLGPDFHADWVRPGVALYGVNPCPGEPNRMNRAVRLQVRIIQVRDVDAGESVGYGSTYHSPDRGRVAVAAAGYADGLFRSLSNRGSGYLKEWRVPMVGRVSMDLVTFDVSHVPEAIAQPGAVIDLIGPDHDLDALAGEAGTIGYEVLTALGARYRRVYTGAGTEGSAS